jgi:uncharacterized membrane protein HdeD (DUF308 family)
MTIHEAGSKAAARLSEPPTWVRKLLGIVLILAGLFVLSDVVLATRTSIVLIGAAAIAAGAFEIILVLWTKGWGGFVWQLVLGALYVAVGIVLLSQPVPGDLMLTYVLGLLLLLSGILRILLALSHWQDVGRLMLLSGTFGVLAGTAILSGFPKTTLWLLALVLGIDLMSHGVAWLTYARSPAARPP